MTDHHGLHSKGLSLWLLLLTLFLLLHRVLADAHTAWVIVLARPPATPCPAAKARLSAHRGVVPGVEESEAEVLGNRSQGTLPAPVLHSPGLVLGIFAPRGSFSTHGPVLPSDHYQASWAAGHWELEPSVPGA